jgi:hypothetical protein
MPTAPQTSPICVLLTRIMRSRFCARSEAAVLLSMFNEHCAGLLCPPAHPFCNPAKGEWVSN